MILWFHTLIVKATLRTAKMLLFKHTKKEIEAATQEPNSPLVQLPWTGKLIPSRIGHYRSGKEQPSLENHLKLHCLLKETISNWEGRERKDVPFSFVFLPQLALEPAVSDLSTQSHREGSYQGQLAGNSALFFFALSQKSCEEKTWSVPWRFPSLPSLLIPSHTTALLALQCPWEHCAILYPAWCHALLLPTQKCL